MSDDSVDILLRRFVEATTEAEVELQLARILGEMAAPIVRNVVASVVRDARGEAEDVVADTIADLLRRLRDLRSDPSREIRDLRGYIVTCAYNRCHERLREHYPARNRLRNHLVYLFNHRTELALWRTGHGATISGLREWIGHPPVPAPRTETLVFPARTDATAENRKQINALVTTALRHLGAPVELDALVGVIARSIHLEQQRIELPLTDADALALTAADANLELRLSLRQLWEDIGELSRTQRAALLLNLRDAAGREALSLLVHTGTATKEEIADAVQIARDAFEHLWPQLPLADHAIGELLGATGRQVIKLRRLARERLRRMSEKRERTGAHQNIGRDSDSSLAGIPLHTGREGRTRR
ncbi:MAG TPA: hypothetical protein VEU30_13320 [Thermoanaerobaculia bacterium]|nr:hypothetical protein [Thermoanaerobaculia bacterium]